MKRGQQRVSLYLQHQFVLVATIAVCEQDPVNLLFNEDFCVGQLKKVQYTELWFMFQKIIIMVMLWPIHWSVSKTFSSKTSFSKTSFSKFFSTRVYVSIKTSLSKWNLFQQKKFQQVVFYDRLGQHDRKQNGNDINNCFLWYYSI